MTEIPPIQEKIIDRKNITEGSILGVLTLGLMFLAAASFTWAIFADAAAPVPAVQVAAAEASQEKAPAVDYFSDITLQAHSAIVVDTTTGRILYAHNPDVQLPLASLTKVPLVLSVAEALPTDAVITMPDGVPQLTAGTRWKISDIIDFTLAISSNEGADVLAEAANESIRMQFPAAPAENATLWRMNQLVRQLGLTHTYFLNDNGLDESTTQSGAYGTARDMAVLFSYAASTTPQTFAATTKQSFSIESINGTRATAINTDDALPAIPAIIMGKTGYTDLAGGNLAIVFDSNEHRIVAVVLGSTQTGRFDDMVTLVGRTKEAVAAK